MSGALVLDGTCAGVVTGTLHVVEFNASRGCASCVAVTLVDTLLTTSPVLPAGAATFVLLVVQSSPPPVVLVWKISLLSLYCIAAVAVPYRCCCVGEPPRVLIIINI